MTIMKGVPLAGFLLLSACDLGEYRVVVPAADSVFISAQISVAGLPDSPVTVDQSTGPVEVPLPREGYDLTILAVGEDPDGVKRVDLTGAAQIGCVARNGVVGHTATPLQGASFEADPDVGPGDVSLSRRVTGLTIAIDLEELSRRCATIPLHSFEASWIASAWDFHGGMVTTPVFRIVYPLDPWENE